MHVLLPDQICSLRCFLATCIQGANGNFGFVREESLVLTAVVLSNVFFIGAALGLLHLSRRVLGSRRAAVRSTLLFCCNPAGVFMTTAYTENLFACATFWGLYFSAVAGRQVVPMRRRCGAMVSVAAWIASLVLLGIASATRSNGMVACVYTLWPLVTWFARYLSARSHRGSPVSDPSTGTTSTTWDAIIVVSTCIVTNAPRFLYDQYCYRKFCVRAVGDTNDAPEWCDEPVQRHTGSSCVEINETCVWGFV
eukprot:m.1181049 g.1181049  ORF g.1181049 m.1181049 type:complete len:252 (-) comp24533_c0_seq6:2889-3644(-)